MNFSDCKFAKFNLRSLYTDTGPFLNDSLHFSRLLLRSMYQPFLSQVIELNLIYTCRPFVSVRRNHDNMQGQKQTKSQLTSLWLQGTKYIEFIRYTHSSIYIYIGLGLYSFIIKLLCYGQTKNRMKLVSLSQDPFPTI